MRRFGPSATARTLTRDFEYRAFNSGWRKIYINPVMAGLDDVFPKPMKST
jgi:hypothetical protein